MGKEKCNDVMEKKVHSQSSYFLVTIVLQM